MRFFESHAATMGAPWPMDSPCLIHRCSLPVMSVLMPKKDECLTLDQLKLFVGVTDAPSQLSQHLETCRDCCEQLERLQSTDPVTSMSMLGKASQGDNEA